MQRIQMPAIHFRNERQFLIEKFAMVIVKWSPAKAVGQLVRHFVGSPTIKRV